MDKISFPKIGLNLSVNPIATSIFGKSIYWYGIIIAVGIVVALVYAIAAAKKNGLGSDTFYDVVLWGLPSALIGARLYYVVFSWKDYAETPLKAFAIWEGGIAIYGAIIGALISTVVFCKIKKINFWKVVDIGAVGLLIGQAVGRWGNFINQEAFGSNTTLPWGMTSDKIKNFLIDLKSKGINVDPNIPVHPTFLYESLWNIVGIFVVLTYKKFAKRDGEAFWMYILWYGVGRAFIEGLRTDSLMLGNMRFSQFVAIITILLASIFLFIFRNKEIKEINI